MLAFCQILILVLVLQTTAQTAVSNLGTLTRSCTSDTNCKTLDWGLRKLENGKEVADTKDGKCCKSQAASSGKCYHDDWYTCHAQVDVPDRLGKLVCKNKDKPCGSICCDRTEQRCEEYKDTNDFVRKTCVKKFNRRITFWIVALPIVICLLMLAGIGMSVVTMVRDRMFLGAPTMLAMALAMTMSLLSLAFVLSSAWKYSVIILGTSIVGIAGVKYARTGQPVVVAFVLVIHFFLCLALLGWGDNNAVFAGWGEGILSDSSLKCSPQWEGWFNRDGITSGKWTNAVRALAADKDFHRIGKPWGLCDEEWLVALRVLGAIEIAMSWILLMLHLANAIWVPKATFQTTKNVPSPVTVNPL